MQNQALSTVLRKAEDFVEEGCRSIMEDGPLTDERYLISPCPVSTALAVMCLSTKPGKYRSHIKSGLDYLNTARNPDGGWGRTPRSPSDERSTEVCRTALKCAESGVTSASVKTVADNIGATWLQDVPRLILDWPSDAPVLKLLELFITNKTGSGLLVDVSFAHLPAVLALLPPGGRPLILALSCMREAARHKHSRALQSAVKKLASYRSANGAWCEDILITCLGILCLAITGRHLQDRLSGLKWLASVQYRSGAWPSFNQLTNWAIGLTSFAAGEILEGKGTLIEECARFLSVRANRDGSFGTLSPYAFPDLDDTAVALLGLNAALRHNDSYAGPASRTAQLLVSLQNKDGSWATFPEVRGTPPACASLPPVHIKSVDVTVHVVQALLKSGTAINSPHIQKGLWWLAFRQKWDGSWKSTWYTGDAYATAQVLELLAECGIRPNSRMRARNWLLAAQNENGGWPVGSAGECGLALTALLKNGADPASPPVQRGLAYISSRQQADGAFTPAYGGLYASGLYYEDPITEALAAIRAITNYLKNK